MRHARNPQMELGDIRINLKSQDDIPALLLGLSPASLCRPGDPYPAVCASQ